MKRITIELPDHFPLAWIDDALRMLCVGKLQYRYGYGLVAVHPEAHSGLAREAAAGKPGAPHAAPEVA